MVQTVTERKVSGSDSGGGGGSGGGGNNKVESETQIRMKKEAA